MEIEKHIPISLEFGKLILFKHNELQVIENPSTRSPEQHLIFKESRLTIITKNDKLVFNDFNLSAFEGIKVTYEKPAKGGGIVSVNFKKSENELVDGFYIYLKIDRNELTGWNYQKWNEKVEWFDKEIISNILSLTTKQIIEKYEYSNC